jgi:hypothetical protein
MDCKRSEDVYHFQLHTLKKQSCSTSDIKKMKKHN